MRLDHTTIGSTRLARPLITASVALLLTCVAGNAAAAAPESGPPAGIRPSPSGTAFNAYAWVVARHPLKLHYKPAPADRGDSEGGAISIDRVDTGTYIVNVPGMDNEDGTVQVTPLGDSATRCVVGGWAVDGSRLQVQVACSNASGAAAPTAFSMTYITYGISPFGQAHLAYLFADQPSEISTYTPDTDFNFDSAFMHSGDTPVYNTVQRSGPGHYTVSIPGLGSKGGHVQVVAVQLFGVTVACRVVAWAPDGGAMLVSVLCRDLTGTPVDTYFDLTFVKSLKLTGYSASRGAYLFADHPTSASYHPAKAYRYSSADTVPTVKRSGKGRYSVILPGMPSGGAAQVTPFGPGKTRCNLSSIRTSGSPQTVGVRCYDIAGHLADSRFTLAYVH